MSIFFLSDFGADSIYVAACNAVALSIAPTVPFVNITHSLPPQKVEAAAMLLEDIAPYLPPDSIVVAVVDPTVGSKRRILAVRKARIIFIAPDNGLLTPFLDGADLFSVTNEDLFRHPVSSTFHGRDIMVPVAAHLASGTPLEAVGRRIDDPARIKLPEPEVRANRIDGEVIAVDVFGNLITDVKESHLLEAFGTKDVEELSKRVRLRVGNRIVSSYYRFYSEAPFDELFAIIGSFGRLEMSMRSANAHRLTGIDVGTSVSLYAHPKC